LGNEGWYNLHLRVARRSCTIAKRQEAFRGPAVVTSLLVPLVALLTVASAVLVIVTVTRQGQVRALALDLEAQRRLGALAQQLQERLEGRAREAFAALRFPAGSPPGRERIWQSVREWQERVPHIRFPFLCEAGGGLLFPFPQRLHGQTIGVVPGATRPLARDLVRLERMAYETAGPRAAIPLLLALLARTPGAADRAAIQYTLGRCYERLAMIPQAVSYYRRAVEGGERISAARLLSLRQLGRLLPGQGGGLEAANAARELLESLLLAEGKGDVRWGFLREEAQAVVRQAPSPAEGNGARIVTETLDESAFPSRRTLPDWEETGPRARGGSSPRERALFDLVAPQDEAYSFYRAVREAAGPVPTGPLGWRVTTDRNGHRRWLAAVAPFPPEGMAGFAVDPAWVSREILPSLVSAWFDPEQATITLAPEGSSPVAGVRTRATILPDTWLELRFLPGFAPDRQARRSVRLEVGLTAALATLVLLGLLLVRRQARFEIRLARMRGDLIDSLSHTLRTPLARMRLLAENLQQGWVADEAKRREYLGAIVTESDRLAGVVEKLLEAGQTEEPASPAPRVLQPLAPLLRAAAARAVGPGGLTDLRLRLDETVPPVAADGEALTAAVAELLENARKYAGKGPVELSLSRRGRWAEVAVADRGPGLRWRDRRRLFRKYFRAGGAMASAREGSGLGLYLVDRTVRAHGGRVTAGRRPGGGSLMVIRLPLEEKHG